jgi:predicted HTH domain antitoxin
MTQIVLEFGPDTMAALRQGPAQLAGEVKTAAVVQWYAEGRISQSKAAEILGMSRTRFLDELYRRRVPALQIDIVELREEIACLTRQS